MRSSLLIFFLILLPVIAMICFILSEGNQRCTYHGFEAVAVLAHNILEILESQLVSNLVLAVGTVVLLNCVVGQVDIQVIQRLSVCLVGFRRSSKVAFLEPVQFHVLGQQHPYPNIELPAAY